MNQSCGSTFAAGREKEVEVMASALLLAAGEQEMAGSKKKEVEEDWVFLLSFSYYTNNAIRFICIYCTCALMYLSAVECTCNTRPFACHGSADSQGE